MMPGIGPTSAPAFTIRIPGLWAFSLALPLSDSADWNIPRVGFIKSRLLSASPSLLGMIREGNSLMGTTS